MGRRQCKNAFNNVKDNMASHEPSDSITATTELSNTDEAEENNLKNNFMKVIKVLTGKMKQSLKEIKDKRNK